MVRIVKAHDEPDGTVFELSVVAGTERGAVTRAGVALFGRMPGKISALEDTDVMRVGNGFVNEYRVMFKISDEGEIRDILGVDKLSDLIGRRL